MHPCCRNPAGDTGIVQDGYYKLLGRTSVDIIKHGGYKASGACARWAAVAPQCCVWGWRSPVNPPACPVLLAAAHARRQPLPLPLCLPRPWHLDQISALHIESALLEHPLLAEVAVLGLPDEVYGEVGWGGVGGRGFLLAQEAAAGVQLGTLRRPSGRSDCGKRVFGGGLCRCVAWVWPGCGEQPCRSAALPPAATEAVHC